MAPGCLTIDAGRVELTPQAQSLDLWQLQEEVNRLRPAADLIQSSCAGCGGCCSGHIPVLGPDLPLLRQGLGVSLTELLQLLDVPQPPDLQERNARIFELAQLLGVDEEQAALIHDFSVLPAPHFHSCEDGSCPFLAEGLCQVYSSRPYTCRLYVCAMGEKLSALQEGIVRLGTWDLLRRLGRVETHDLPDNPLARGKNYSEVLVSDIPLPEEEGTTDALYLL